MRSGTILCLNLHQYRQHYFDHKTVQHVARDRGGGGAGEAAEARDEQAEHPSQCTESRQPFTIAIQRTPQYQQRGEGGSHEGTKLYKSKARSMDQNVVAEPGRNTNIFRVWLVVDEEVHTFRAEAHGEDDRLLKPEPKSALK